MRRSPSLIRLRTDWQRLFRAAVAAGLATTLLMSTAHAEPPDQARLKAAFVSRIARFVDWPEGTFETPNDPIRVGVLGSDMSLDALVSELAGTKAGTRGFEVVRLREAAQAEAVQIVIVGQSGKLSLRRIARELRGKAVLSIAPSFSFAEDGGILGIEIYRGKVAFEVNNRSAREADLKISSRVLRMASVVY